MDCSRDVSVYNDYSALGLADTAAHNKGKLIGHLKRYLI